MATMAYTPAYTYDALPRSLSRAASYIAPQPLMYSQSIYSNPLYTNTPYSTYDYSRSSTSLVPFSRPMTAFGNTYDPYYSTAVGHVPLSRPRVYSGASYMSHLTGINQHPFSTFRQIRFKRKGAFSAGVTLAEAQAHIRLSHNDHYTIYDLNADGRGTIHLSVTWNGYPQMAYQIPLDSRTGRFSLETLARRISRACVHYLQSNGIPVSRDRIELHHIEEVTHGVWQPMLRAI